MDTAISIYSPDAVEAVAAAANQRIIVQTMRADKLLVAGRDYGDVAGGKPTLYKAGAERLCAAFHLAPKFNLIEQVADWNEEHPLFYFRYECVLTHIESGYVIATGIGSCNSREDKYRWRWVNEGDVPAWLDKSRLVTRNGSISEPDFAIDRAETTGKYGKPMAYWQQFKDALGSGDFKRDGRLSKDKSKTINYIVIGGLQFRVPNDEIFTLINTMDKMACKRALVASTLIGTGASADFTQDVEDLPGFTVTPDDQNVVDGEFTETSGIASGTGQQQPVQQKPVQVVDHGAWLRAAGAVDALLKWATEQFDINEVEVLEALQVTDTNAKTILGANVSKMVCMAAIIAYAQGYEDDEIGIYTSSMTGQSDESKLKLDDLAKRIAADERKRLADTDFDAPAKPIQALVYERVIHLFHEIKEEARVAHYGNLWNKLKALDKFSDNSSEDVIVAAFETYYSEKDDIPTFDNLQKIERPETRQPPARRSSAR